MSDRLPAPGKKAPRWAWWVATGFGSGYLRPAPGTWGSLAALCVWSAAVAVPGFLMDADHLNVAVPLLWLAAPALAGAGIYSSNLIVDETGLKDPSFIVIDEWAGLWIAMLPSSVFVSQIRYSIVELGYPHWVLVAPILIPFLLFRLFDIWKPWPIFRIQSLPRGWGVVVDDLVAGLYAAFLTAILMPWFPMGPGKG